MVINQEFKIPGRKQKTYETYNDTRTERRERSEYESQMFI